MADINKGWITILRSIQDHEIWRKTPFGKGQAWIDLILSANHKDNKVMIGNTIHEIKRGSFITSQRKLAEKWGWSRNTARSFLSLLQSQRMIEQKTTHELSHITIINYNTLQKTSPTNRTTIEPPIEPDKSHLLNTNNNVTMKQCNKKDIASSADFINQIKSNPAYSHIDIDTELNKMDIWILANPKRKKNNKFIANWLNKIPRPVKDLTPTPVWNDLKPR